MQAQTRSQDFITAPADLEARKPKAVKAPFGYLGAKQRLASRIVASLPPHNAWVEAFCGSAAITLAKPPAPIEVINDMDGQVVNLFEQLRNNPDALCRAVSLTPYARQEFQDARKPSGKLNPLEKARRFLVGTMMTVNSTIGNHSGFSFSQSFTRAGMEARVSRWYSLPERLAHVVERLRHVRIENRDARELLQMFLHRPATLVYLDPPYFVKREFKYVIDANEEAFHQELLDLCCKAKCMILISGYETDLYNTVLQPSKGWKCTILETHTRDTTGKDYARTEFLWHNKHFTDALKSGQVPIHLTRKEREEKKINPPRP
jgi:DNA adenine methylase